MTQKKMEQIKCYCGHTTYCDCGPLEEKPYELGYCLNCEWNHDMCPHADECLKNTYPKEDDKTN